MRFLLDNNLPPALARALNELSKQDPRVKAVIALRDRFDQNTPDTQWLQELHDEGDWCIISGDAFKKSDAEKDIIRKAGFVVFVLHKSWSSQKYWPKCTQLVMWWPRIVDQAHEVSKAAFRVPWRATSRFEQIKF